MRVVDIEHLKSDYFAYGYPCPYELKYGGVTEIYPIKTKDWGKFERFLDILLLDKNAVIDDIEVIEMCYLEYLMKRIIANEEKIKDTEITVSEYKLLKVISYALRVENVSLDYRNNKPIILVGDKSGMVVKAITHKEFDDISRIILYQNIVNYDDSYIDPELKAIKEEYIRIKNKENGYTSPSIERKLSVVTIESGMIKKDLLELDYREFLMLFDTIVEKIDYQINKRADLQNKEFKTPIRHWIYESSNKGILDGALIEKGDFDNKMKNVANKP